MSVLVDEREILLEFEIAKRGKLTRVKTHPWVAKGSNCQMTLGRDMEKIDLSIYNQILKAPRFDSSETGHFSIFQLAANGRSGGV